jgi:hypothetical protein
MNFRIAAALNRTDIPGSVSLTPRLHDHRYVASVTSLGRNAPDRPDAREASLNGWRPFFAPLRRTGPQNCYGSIAVISLRPKALAATDSRTRPNRLAARRKSNDA